MRPLGLAATSRQLAIQPGRTSDRKKNGEHVHRDADRAHDDAAVEIDVRIEFPRDEIVVLQRGLLEVLRDGQERVLIAQLFQHVVAGLADDLGARIEIAINRVAKAHQAVALAAGFRRLR